MSGSLTNEQRHADNCNCIVSLRLCRRQDGDALAAVVDDADGVQEHMWISP